jgi:hypothetical protein
MKQVDSYKFLSLPSRRIVKEWIAREPARDIPWTPLAKPLAEAVVALVTTAAAALRTDRPFDQDGERRNPDTSYAEGDLNCVLPLRRLLELEAASEIGRSDLTSSPGLTRRLPGCKCP